MSVSVLKLVAVVEDLYKIVDKLDQIVKQLSSDLPKIDSKLSLIATEGTLKDVALALDNVKQSIDSLASVVSRNETLVSVIEKLGELAKDSTLYSVLSKLNETLTTLQDILSKLGELGKESTLQNINSTLQLLSDVKNALQNIQSSLEILSALNKLDTNLSTRASEETLSGIHNTLNTILPRINVDLSTRASESTLSSILTLLTSLLTSSGNTRVALVETTIKQPVDIQDHLSESVTILSSGTRTASGSGSDVDVARFAFGDFCVDVTAVSGTSPTLSVYVEGRIRALGKYRVLCSFENISSVTTLCCTVNPLSYALVRARWVIGGTSPSFTFSVVGELKS